jgi:dTDP-4-dehydrorhamnose 3,5-epimerase
MEFCKTSINDVLLLKPLVYEDSRGFFFESYNTDQFRKAGIKYSFVQDNHSRSNQGTIRGLHYQLPHPQGKLVRVAVGEIFDVAVDIRQSSSTFGKWFGCNISENNHYQLWIPPGFAHGFLTISKWAEVLYKATDFYFPESEHTILWNDPVLGINWPNELTQQLIISDKDLKGLRFQDAVVFA